MAAYSTYTVAQLKELLKVKGLSTSGVKSELVARLEATDSPASEATPTETVSEIDTAPKADSAPSDAAAAAVAEEPVPPVKEAEAKGDLTVIQPEETKSEELTKKEEEKPKEMSPEEIKAAAIELLQKKIARAKKFNDEEAQKAAEKDLARAQKFGVAPGTALAKEIGLTSGNVSLGSKDFRVSKDNFRRGHRGNKNKKFNRRR